MWLSRAVAIGWITWLLSVALVWSLYRWRVMHPQFLPLGILFAVQALAASTAMIGGTWRVLRGPCRQRAASYLLLGTTPIWLWSAHLAYGIWCFATSSIPFNALLKSVAVIAATAMDGKPCSAIRNVITVSTS